MRNAALLLASCTLALSLPCLDVRAAPGDLVVPAHRTRDGHWVPANVPPASGGTHLARRPARGVAKHRATRAPTRTAQARSPRLLPPLLVEAQPTHR